MMKHEIPLWRLVMWLRRRGHTRQQVADMTRTLRKEVLKMTRRKDTEAWWALWLRRRGHTYQQVAGMMGTYRGKARMQVARALVIERKRTYRELRILRRNAEAELRLVRARLAYEMRYAGHTYKEIGDRFQISRERARQIVIGECRRRCRTNRIHWRGLELLEESLRAHG